MVNAARGVPSTTALKMKAPLLLICTDSEVPEKRATNPLPDQENRGRCGSVRSTRPTQRTPAATTPGCRRHRRSTADPGGGAASFPPAPPRPRLPPLPPAAPPVPVLAAAAARGAAGAGLTAASACGAAGPRRTARCRRCAAGAGLAPRRRRSPWYRRFRPRRPVHLRPCLP